MSRPYDVVVLGATGFTGRYVAEYLAEQHGDLVLSKKLKLAIAGRSTAKLESVRKDILKAVPKLSESDIGIMEYSSEDQASVDKVVASTKVVVACAGPFTRMGTPIVKACVEKGTHYTDITGETPWIRKLIDTYHDAAVANGTIIVPSCGFDSVPSDISAYVLGDFIKSKYGEGTKAVKMSVTDSKSGVSGGTLGTVREMLASGDPEVAASGKNRYYLNPKDKQSGPDKGGIPFHYDADLKAYQGFWVMASGNSRIVRRSQALLNYPFANFSYSETQGYKSRLALWAGTFGLAVLGVMMALPPTRWLLFRFVLPAPGQGTLTHAERKTNYFEMKGVGIAESGKKAFLRWYGPGDAGYGETAKYAAEAALCMALEKEKCPGKGGILTPATAFGDVLVDRLRKSGTIIEVGDKEI